MKGAHAIEREVKVLSALGTECSPGAHVLCLCTGNSVIGAWLYVIDMVEGRIFWDAAIPEISNTTRPAYSTQSTRRTQRHGFDPEAFGLGDYRRPGNYFELQIKR
ncbi:MAG: hypothetical protein AB7L36_12740 [Sphingomonadaceae bacterium]